LNDPRVDVNKRNRSNETPFFQACLYGRSQSIQLFLFNERVDTNATNNFGLTPVSALCQSNENVMALAYFLLFSDDDSPVFAEKARRNIKNNSLNARFCKGRTIQDLLDAYDADPNNTLTSIRKWFSIKEISPPQLFVFVVLTSDDYFKINQDDRSKKPSKKQSSIRFFRILVRLPMEIQMKTCNSIQMLSVPFIRTKLFSQTLQKMILEGFIR